MDASAELREPLLAYAAVVVGCGLVFALSGIPFVADNQQLAVGSVFLLAALELAHRDRGGPARLGLSFGGLVSDEPLGRALRGALPSALRETGFALGLAALIFPVFTAGYVLYHQPAGDFSFTLPPHAGRFVAAQLIAVALPEEAFFRGYLMTKLTDAFGGERRILGAKISLPALFAQAALFALVHFVFDWDPARLAVFAPALVFGWLRALRGGVGAAIVFHAACNLLAELLYRGYS